MKSKTHYLRLLAAGSTRLDATTKALGYKLSTANSDETILSAGTDQLYIVEVLVSVPAGLTASTVIVKDGTTKVLESSIDPATAVEVICNPKGLPFDGDLIMQAGDTEPIINAWAMLV